MEATYTNINHPAAFGGVDRLRRATNKSRKETREYLRKNSTYRKFFRNKTKFERARILVASLGHIFQADIFDLQKFSRQNKGFKYILVVVDCFSRLVKARPLKTKGATDVSIALKEMFNDFKEEDRLAYKSLIGTDRGNEFYNKEVDKVFDEFHIHHYALYPPKKASLAEISGRYLLDRIYKYMHAKSTKNWVDDLGSFVDAKNKRLNKSLGGIASNQVTFENQDQAAISRKIAVRA